MKTGRTDSPQLDVQKRPIKKGRKGRDAVRSQRPLGLSVGERDAMGVKRIRHWPWGSHMGKMIPVTFGFENHMYLTISGA